ncbi:sulfite oxidase heme-binding subunit YedZ, partial [Sulfurivirga sp.]|uniref:sulfite oxidase heme-binding subunit YedZ n=1 Tax=Sulfurivirga sp. TaxID=2614236 RepID=UPI0025DD7FE3
MRVATLILLTLLPALWTAWDMAMHGPGAEPARRLEHVTGDWALYLLLLTLTVRPLWRTMGWRSSFVWLRRTVGLMAFAYASVHLVFFVLFELNLDLGQLVAQVAEKPWVTLGMAAWLMLLPLAVTSTTGWQRRLGRHWARLHQLIYPATLLGILHYLWLVKKDISTPLALLAVFGVLMGWRLWLHRR